MGWVLVFVPAIGTFVKVTFSSVKVTFRELKVTSVTPKVMKTGDRPLCGVGDIRIWVSPGVSPGEK